MYSERPEISEEGIFAVSFCKDFMIRTQTIPRIDRSHTLDNDPVLAAIYKLTSVANANSQHERALLLPAYVRSTLYEPGALMLPPM